MIKLTLLERLLVLLLAPVIAVLGSVMVFVAVLGGLIYGALFNTLEIKTNEQD